MKMRWFLGLVAGLSLVSTGALGLGWIGHGSGGRLPTMDSSLSDFVRSFQEGVNSATIHNSEALPDTVAVSRLRQVGSARAAPPPPHPEQQSSRPPVKLLDLSGKVAFVAGVSDSSGFGWAIAKELHKAGATVLVGSWVPMVLRFEKLLASGALDEDRKYDTIDGPGTGRLDIEKIYPLDVAFDEYSDIPDEVKNNRRFSPLLAAGRGFSIGEVASQVAKDFGRVDILVHSIANGPEVSRPLLQTSRSGYLAALGSSAYSLVSLVQKFGPLMSAHEGHSGGAVVSLTYLASEVVVPGYGGGMSSAKAALESDTRTLAYEVGRTYGIRVNTISAGPLKSRAANAIKKPRESKSFIDYAIAYNKANAPLMRDLNASDVASSALFLLSPMAEAVTGVTLYVDNGMHMVGMASDSKSLQNDGR